MNPCAEHCSGADPRKRPREAHDLAVNSLWQSITGQYAGHTHPAIRQWSVRVYAVIRILMRPGRRATFGACGRCGGAFRPADTFSLRGAVLLVTPAEHRHELARVHPRL